MIIVKIQGGLGNQMFQYALGRALAEKHSQELYLDAREYLRSTSKIVEWEKKKRAKRIKNVLQCPMC